MDATVRAALPKWLGVIRADSWRHTYDVTPLVEEWALVFLDPVEALRRNVAQALSQPGWSLCAKATVTPTIHRLLRDAAADGEVEERVREALSGGTLGAGLLPLLLGVAAVTAVEANIGRAAGVALGELKKRERQAEVVEAMKEREQTDNASEAAQRERQRSAPAASRPAAAVRPTLTPIPDDAWGRSVARLSGDEEST